MIDVGRDGVQKRTSLTRNYFHVFDERSTKVDDVRGSRGQWAGFEPEHFVDSMILLAD